MKRETGWITAVTLAFAAMVGISVLPSRNSSSLPGSNATQAAKTVVAKKGAAVHEALPPPCQSIENRIGEFFPEGTIAAPKECFDHPSNAPRVSPEAEKHSTLHFIIATLPNPVHTHFSLSFDRLADAIQQAAQDQGYNYDSSWLPWSDQRREYELLADQQAADAIQDLKEKQPGVLVFRKALPDSQPRKSSSNCDSDDPYCEGLVIFLVGENPTGGIATEQFVNAVKWITALRPSDSSSNLRILGPSFSGSLPSLAGLLTDVSEVNTFAKSHKPEVFSGAVTSRAGIVWFQDFLHRHDLGRFTTFQENDDLLINRYCWLLRRQGYDTGKLAIISEDETAFGVIGQPHGPDRALYECTEPAEKQADATGNPATQAEEHGPLTLYYPRDIASLRSAYEKQSVFSSNTQSQQSTKNSLPDTLSDSSGGDRDTIRSYGGEQTPLSQESTLFAMVNLLHAHSIEFIVLRSSNALDQIFLTRFLDRSYPDARVVLTNSDLMFRRSSQSAGFRGAMTLTTYPLLTWQQDWTFWQVPESRHSHRAFPDSGSEGLYLATRFLVSSKGGAGKTLLEMQGDSSVIVQDYGPPSWLLPNSSDPTRPPTWLSVLGSGQVWPVAVMQDYAPPAEVHHEKYQPGDIPAGTYYVRTSYFGAPGETPASRRHGQKVTGSTSARNLIRRHSKERPNAISTAFLTTFTSRPWRREGQASFRHRFWTRRQLTPRHIRHSCRCLCHFELLIYRSFCGLGATCISVGAAPKLRLQDVSHTFRRCLGHSIGS